MKLIIETIFLLSFATIISSDFYLGMFKKHDYLVAQDRLYKERVPYRLQYAKYGRLFKCLITYVRVVDRLGYGAKPKTTIIRGGLKKKYVVLRISAYNKPISVNIYVGCQNKKSGIIPTTRMTKTTVKLTTVADSTPGGGATNDSTGNSTGPDAPSTEAEKPDEPAEPDEPEDESEDEPKDEPEDEEEADDEPVEP